MQHKNKSKSIEGFDNALKMGLVASTGRGLKGHGHKVFVYGTLMKGNSNYESFLGDAEFVGGVIAKGFALYDLGSYPGIIHSERDG